MPKQSLAAQALSSLPHEDVCEYVADLSRQLADILRHRGLGTIVGLLDLASVEAERIIKSAHGATKNESGPTPATLTSK